VSRGAHKTNPPENEQNLVKQKATRVSLLLLKAKNQMSDTPKEKTPAIDAAKEEKQPGLFGRIFQKLDESMKQKAQTKAEQGSCCGSSGKDKGGKCC
jgi:hypothetical protein